MTAPKFRGQSTYQLRQRLNEAGELARARMITTNALTAQIQAKEDAAKAEVVRLMKLPPETRLRLAYSLECPESPTERCLYDLDEDPACDDCLICHDPMERL